MMFCVSLTKNSVRPELVEGLSFFAAPEEGQGFDKLSLTGFFALFGDHA